MLSNSQRQKGGDLDSALDSIEYSRPPKRGSRVEIRSSSPLSVVRRLEPADLVNNAKMRLTGGTTAISNNRQQALMGITANP